MAFFLMDKKMIQGHLWINDSQTSVARMVSTSGTPARSLGDGPPWGFCKWCGRKHAWWSQRLSTWPWTFLGGEVPGQWRQMEGGLQGQGLRHGSAKWASLGPTLVMHPGKKMAELSAVTHGRTEGALCTLSGTRQPRWGWNTGSYQFIKDSSSSSFPVIPPPTWLSHSYLLRVTSCSSESCQDDLLKVGLLHSELLKNEKCVLYCRHSVTIYVMHKWRDSPCILRQTRGDKKWPEPARVALGEGRAPVGKQVSFSVEK